LLSQLRAQTECYGVNIVPGVVEQLEIQSDGSFLVKARNIERRAKKVLLATGVVDIEPALPDLENAICRGFIRHCPVCDGYEVIDQKMGLWELPWNWLKNRFLVRLTY
jgi:thioredoxin reductase (NADPH)